MTYNPHANDTAPADAASGQVHRVPVRQPRPPSPRRRAAGIAQAIVDRLEEGGDWTWDEFDIEGDDKMIALVKSYLAFEFSIDVDEPEPIPDAPAAGGVRMIPLHAEAPVSANCRLTIEGHDVQVTVRSGASPAEVEVVVGTMAGLLQAYASQPLAAVKSPQPSDASPPAERQTETPYCHEHGQTFHRHEKDGQVWYSHKIAGSQKWCRY